MLVPSDRGLLWDWTAALLGKSWQSSVFGFLKLATMVAIGYPDIVGSLPPKWRGLLFVLYGLFNAVQGRQQIDPAKIVTVDNPPAPVLHSNISNSRVSQLVEKDQEQK